MYYTIPPEPERRVRDMNSLQMHVGSRKETEVSDVSSGDADVKDKWTQTEECYHGKCLLMFTTFQFSLEKNIFEDRRIVSCHTNLVFDHQNQFLFYDALSFQYHEMCPVVIMSFEHTIMGSCSYTFTAAQLNI